MLPKAEGDEKDRIVPALTGVFAEALRGGVSNLSVRVWCAGGGPGALLSGAPVQHSMRTCRLILSQPSP